jgi:hypothetical protein
VRPDPQLTAEAQSTSPEATISTVSISGGSGRKCHLTDVRSSRSANTVPADGPNHSAPPNAVRCQPIEAPR